MALEPTVASPPSTNEVTSQVLATMAALSGVLTDYNIGSQIRTIVESVGSVAEQQGIAVQALAFQSFLYGAMTLFGITPYTATQAVAGLTFSTAASAGPNATQNISIPSGTVVQTSGGTQFSTLAAATLLSGTASISVSAQAVIGGLAGNVPAGAINQIVTGILYPLYITNGASGVGGSGAESISQTVARFSSRVAALPTSSPVAIANSAIGVIYSGTGEVVRYSTLYEPWIAAGSGAGSGTAGWTLYIDNGTGAASTGLINTVISNLNGGPASGQIGYRDAGVPYAVSAVVPTIAVVSVTGIVSPLTTTGAVSGLIVSAVSGYFSLPFGSAAQLTMLSQSVGNAVLGLMSTLSISLYQSGSATPLSSLATAVTGRIVLGSLSMTLTAS